MRKEKGISIDEIVDMMKAPFGDAIKAFWVYEDDLCPCCLSRPIDFMIYNKQKAMSLNTFMYRERGVLIAYMLCGHCAPSVMKETENGPKPMHESIEKNLIAAYQFYCNSLDA